MNALLQRWHHRRRLPLRVTLVAAMLALVTVALIVIGVAGSTLLQRYLVARVDNQLKASASSVANTALRTGFALPDPVERVGPVSLYYVGVIESSGSIQSGVVVRPGERTPPGPRLGTITPDEAAARNQNPFTVGSVSGSRRWRVDIVALPNHQSVIVAFPLDDVNSTVNRLIWIDVIASAIVLAALGILGYFMIRSSLRPLVKVERTAEAIAAGDLARRVEVADEHTEVGRLGTSLNTMLGQIEDAFHARERSELNARASEERMRRFVADAGHELRTPLTSVRGFAELYRMGAVADDVELARVMKRIEDEASRMGLLVEDLLLLARLDQQRPLEHRPVELLELATDAVTDLHALHPERELRLITDPSGEPPVVMGDEGRLRQVIGNLLGNAFTHTPDGTQVRLSVAVEGPFAVLAVGDNGPGMRPEDAARVFERFFRADPSRVRSSGGSGLGLSIVAALVAAHGGSVEVDSKEGVGTTFTVRLPLANAVRPPAPPPPPMGVASHPQPSPAITR
ncbi:MAG TPA: HAMP domain-containing sensor histidine kinase [Frankiaceae bacterium]|jgi:two-component system OmpR family sensor kinase|nr:HAMP domain-containing sensor histidine kinase [Frankiaceae bacterium]